MILTIIIGSSCQLLHKDKNLDVDLEACVHSLQYSTDVDVDVVDLRAQADASMPASNNNVKLYNISRRRRRRSGFTSAGRCLYARI